MDLILKFMHHFFNCLIPQPEICGVGHIDFEYREKDSGLFDYQPMQLSSAPPPPLAPDYKGAAVQTAQGNLESARAAAAANRINQYTPYGSITYSKDPNSTSPDEGWTQTTRLSPEQQKLLDRQNATSLGLPGLQDQGLEYVKEALANNISYKDIIGGGVPDYIKSDWMQAGKTGQNALMDRYQPQMAESRAALDSQLANQGILPGSKAYENAMRTQYQGENDLRSQAALHGIGLEQSAKQQYQNQLQGYQQHKLGLMSAAQNNPINILNAVRTGSQVTNPQFSGYAQQGQTAGPDYLGAAQGQNQYNMGLYNSQVASANAGNSGLMGLLGTGAMAGAMY